MTLDVKKLLVNIIKKQMQIQHMSAPVDVFKKEHIPEKIAAKIAAEFGDDYLLDSNMIVFYRGEFDKDQVEKLFSITNKAFGEDANRMTLGDFKKFSMDSDGPVPQPGDDDSSKGSEDAAEQNADAVADQGKEEGKEAGAPAEQPEDAANDGEEEKAEEQSPAEASSQPAGAGSEEDEEDKQLDKEVDEIVNGGDSEEQVNEDDAALQQEDPAAPPSNAYLFLKITTK